MSENTLKRGECCCWLTGVYIEITLQLAQAIFHLSSVYFQHLQHYSAKLLICSVILDSKLACGLTKQTNKQRKAEIIVNCL